MKIGIAQLNATVGALARNQAAIKTAYAQLAGEGADLVVFPELAVCGYPPRDLLFKRRFVPDTVESLEQIAADISGPPAIVGFVEPTEKNSGRFFYNAAAFCRNGNVEAVARKCLLPTYDVFDEDRYFEAADQPLVLDWNGSKLAITICEDIWPEEAIGGRRRYEAAPLKCLQEQERIDLHVNISASPWHTGKSAVRERLVADAAKACRCPTVYVNAVGGNDELIFDGRSMAASAKGEIVAGLPAFSESCQIVDLDASPSIDPTFRQPELQDLEDALVIGVRDYAWKSGFKTALVGLSGGIDSAVTAAIAARALGKDQVTGISLPSRISSEHSKADALDLATNLGIQYHAVEIADVVSAAENAIEPLVRGMPQDVTEENLQARSRGLVLMALSNKFGSLLLTTGNKSELAVGYCTLYGDMCGGLAVISDVPKTKVFELARWMNREAIVIPVSTIEKPPSAELRPDQKDEDSLPPYDVLDAILEGYVEKRLSSADLIEQGYDEAVVREIVRKVDLNEYKRKQAAPGLKTTTLAFGVGRRIPIVQKYVS